MIDIDARRLPSSAAVNGWNAEQFVGALRHDPANPAYNPHLRQLHLADKVAAKYGSRYLEALAEHETAVGPNVTADPSNAILNRSSFKG